MRVGQMVLKHAADYWINLSRFEAWVPGFEGCLFRVNFRFPRWWLCESINQLNRIGITVGRAISLKYLSDARVWISVELLSLRIEVEQLNPEILKFLSLYEIYEFSEPNPYVQIIFTMLVSRQLFNTIVYKTCWRKYQRLKKAMN